MDLESLTRYQLEQEAEKAGVTRVHNKTREQLISAIQSSGGGRTSRFGTARKLFGRAVKIARALSERPSDVPESRPPSKPVTTQAEEAKQDKRTLDAAKATSKTNEDFEQAPTSKIEKVPLSEEAKLASEPAAKPKTTGKNTPEEEEKSTKNKKDKKKKKKKKKEQHEFADQEPVPTRTMAKLLAEQGHSKRALAIYKRLVAATPSDSELASEMKALKEKARSRGKRDEADPDGSEVVVVNAGQHRALICWNHEEMEEQLTGLDVSKLSLKAVLIWTEAGQVMKRHHNMSIPATGEWVLEVPAATVNVIASLGYASPLGDFQSVSHSDIVTIR